jgi:hypothetical protein
MLIGLVIRMTEKSMSGGCFSILDDFQVISNLLMEAGLNFLNSPLVLKHVVFCFFFFYLFYFIFFFDFFFFFSKKKREMQ